jgi:hypothetical protein
MRRTPGGEELTWVWELFEVSVSDMDDFPDRQQTPHKLRCVERSCSTAHDQQHNRRIFPAVIAVGLGRSARYSVKNVKHHLSSAKTEELLVYEN